MKKYENFKNNLEILARADRENLENEFVISGIIDKFSLQFELGWKVLKELLRYEGNNTAATGSPREIIKAAYAVYDFIDEQLWLEMLKARNNMNHIYDGQAARLLVERIIQHYIPAFVTLKNNLEERYGRDLCRME